MPTRLRHDSTRASRETLAASDILSDIAPVKSANDDKPTKADERTMLSELAESERLGERSRTAANGRKTIRGTPCLPARLRSPFGRASSRSAPSRPTYQ